MQTIHTAAPWFLAGDDEGTMITDAHGEQIAMWPPQGGTVEQCANARLIASAPDLVAALQTILRSLEFEQQMYGQHDPRRSTIDFPRAISIARAALNKALGE